MMDIRHANKNFYLEQWNLVCRWYNSLEIKNSLLEKQEKASRNDFYFAFFINAYHMKEWIQTWAEENHKDEIVKKLDCDFKNKEFLCDLETICNSCKHFRLYNNAEFATPLSYEG